MAVQQILWIFLYHYIDRVQQPLKISLLDERCAQIWHDEIADEQDAFIRQMDEHGVVSFTSLHRNQFDACATNLQLGAAIDGDIWLETSHVVQIKTFAEKFLAENARSIHFACDFFCVITPGVKVQTRIQCTEIGVPPNVIPVGVCDE